MKNLKSFLVLVLVAFAIVSCGNDDDNGPAPIVNEFTFQGITYTLSQGILESYGDNGNGSFDFDITLFSDGITIDVANDDFTGAGQVVYLDLNSSSMNGLVNGTYNFAIERNAFTIVDGVIITDLDIAAETGTEMEITAGNVVLTIANDQYTIVFNLENAAGEAITGSYQGLLTVF